VVRPIGGSLSFTVEDVERRLLGLDASKGFGPDGVPPRFWRVLMGLSGL
jgi:hypothetical protein